MASKTNAVWAIDIGNCSLKALHLSDVDGQVEVIGFEYIPHEKILAGSGIKAAEREELIALSLREFASRHKLGSDKVVISVPSQNSFARFVQLPPVEKKRIAEIVKFEAAQQIPFDINDVQWDWQLMSPPKSKEMRIGLFAIKNDIVSAELEHFSRENIAVSCVQMAPMALYNYMMHDRGDLCKADKQAVVVLNIGAESTDLVVCTKSGVWQRCVPMGGNAFTRAIAETFKLSFEKAEKLKRTAAMSKYARQIFQAMKPVFTDMASEIQRSLGFYTNVNPDVNIAKVIAMGGGTKMRGLLKYIQQSLQVPVEKPDAFKKLKIGSDVSEAKFHENVADYGDAYGLALQGLDMGKIESNLLPRSIAKSMLWASKAKYFTAAAFALLAVSLICMGRTIMDKSSYNGNSRIRQDITRLIIAAGSAKNRLQSERDKSSAFEATIQKEFAIFQSRNVTAQLYEAIISSLPNATNNPDQKEFYEAFADDDIDGVMATPRKQRKQLFVTGISVSFAENIEKMSFRTDILKASSKSQESTARTVSLGTAGFASFAGESDQHNREQQEEQATAKGFIVTIVGYSPYGNIEELLDPAGVEADSQRWGFVTRLMHLDEVADGNSPFELFNKLDPAHFNIETGQVDLAVAMPTGIGVLGQNTGKGIKGQGKIVGEEVLIDPMTKEIISKFAEMDNEGKKKVDKSGNVIYKINDHWFIINAKFLWAEAAKDSQY
ncbi:MAG: type IV pilus assembly protein PilM [Planctomycetota bacterium]|jgi:type IV pilus assembly protein PilM